MRRMKAAIIVDSTAGLTEETATLSNIYQIYLSTIFEDGTVYIDSPDESLTKDFYDRMDTEKNLPKTSQPDTKQIYDLFEQLVQDGYDTVFDVLLSEKISGTFQSIQASSREFSDQLDIHLIDAQLTSFVMEAMVLNLVELIQRQFEPNDIVTRIKHLLEQSAFYFTPAKLDNLVKGGRVSSLSGFLGNALNIKPIITMGAEHDGQLYVPEKSGRRKRLMTACLRLRIHTFNNIQNMHMSRLAILGLKKMPKSCATAFNPLTLIYPFELALLRPF